MIRGWRAIGRYVAGRAVLSLAVFLALAVLVVSLTSGDRECGEPPLVSAWDFFYGPPQTADELVATTRLVVVGTFEGTTDEVWEYSYDHERVKSVVGPDFEFDPVPVTYYRFVVEEVVYDEDGVASPGGELELRYGGHEIFGCLYLVSDAPKDGERRLLVLGGNPDGSFAPITLYHEFDIDGGHARYVTGVKSDRAVAFQDNDAPNAIIVGIREALVRRGPSPVPPVDFDNLVPRPIAPPPSTQ